MPNSWRPRSWCAGWPTKSRIPSAACAARRNCCKKSCRIRPCANIPASSSNRPIGCGYWSIGYSAPRRPGRHQMHNVHSVLEQVRRLVELELPPSVRIERDYDPSIPEFEMEPDQLQQAFLNIVRNAAEALGDQTGLIRIKTRTAFQITIHGQRYRLAAEIKIIDNGPGIPDAIRDTLFYPMITGKEGGTGLGLSIAQNLIDQHKGRIDCISWPGHTEFTIFLPLRK